MAGQSGLQGVTARFCPFCGQPAVPGGTFCPSCGASLVGSPDRTGSPGSPPPALPLGQAQGLLYSPLRFATDTPSGASREADLHALSSVVTAALVALIAAAISLAGLFLSPTSVLTEVSTDASGTSVTLSVSSLAIFAILAGVGVVLFLLELVYYRDAFRTLAAHDSRFSTPAKLVLLLLVTTVIIGLLGLAVVYLLYEAAVCAGAGAAITSACLNTGSTITVVGLLGLTAVAALVGFIGLLLGLWRLGSRYGEGKFKVGAILLIIPLLNIVGIILILVAARSTRLDISAGEPHALTFG